jgi:hypothetical protein
MTGIIYFDILRNVVFPQLEDDEAVFQQDYTLPQFSNLLWAAVSEILLDVER